MSRASKSTTLGQEVFEQGTPSNFRQLTTQPQLSLLACVGPQHQLEVSDWILIS